MIDDLLTASLSVCKAKSINIYTYSLYYSHEDRLFSVCIDTYENSQEAVKKQRISDMEIFEMKLEDKDYDLLEVGGVRSGRNQSLGDYEFVNVVSSSQETEATKLTIVDAILRVRSRESEIARYSNHGGELLFSVSSLVDEFGIAWYRKV